MTLTARGRLRRLWFNVHLWIGVGLAVLLIPLGLTGSVLVWSDALIGHGPAIHGAPQAALSPSAYLAAAAPALGEDVRPVSLKMPAHPGEAVVVTGRGRPPQPGPGGRGGRPPQVSVSLNPADGAVLAVTRGRPGWWMALHGFHENLMQRGWGRSVVGWLGVAMMISSLTGIWIWWPRSGAFLKGLRFHRTPGFWLNLHHTAGFWISLPLAFVSLTGIGLGFPQTTRGLIARFAPVSAPPGAGGGGPASPDARSAPHGPEGGHRHRHDNAGPRPPEDHDRGEHGHGGPQLTPEAALAKANVAPANLRQLTLPSRQAPAWKVERADGPALQVADADGAVSPAAPPLGGDVFWRWVHRLHGGDDTSIVWKLILTLTGLAPALLGISGVCVWVSRTLRNRRLRATPAA